MRIPTEFELAGRKYRAEKLNALNQGHVSRRIAPLIPNLIPIFVQLSRAVADDNDTSPEAQEQKDKLDGERVMAILARPEVLQPFADALANLKDADFEFVLNTCLAVVKVNHEGNWIGVWNASAKAAMLDDLNDITALLPIVIRVIKDSLGNFLKGLSLSLNAN